MAFVDSSDLITDVEALRERSKRDGYLYFRGLLPKQEVLALRKQLVALCEKYDFFARPPIGPAGEIDAERMGPYYAEAYCLRQVHGIPKHPAVLDVYRRLFGRDPLPHARTVLRTMPHGTRQVWPVHQDYPNVATHDEVWNSWIPVGDCPEKLGSLAILEGSHKLGPTRSRRLADNGLVIDEPPEGCNWLSQDLQCGDVLMFNSLTFHKGQSNLLPGQIRLSLDNCIQPWDTPFNIGSFDLHSGDYGLYNRDRDWDEIYQSWSSDDTLKYYWKKFPVKFVEPLDMPIHRVSTD